MKLILCSLTWQEVIKTGWITTLIFVCIIICCYYIFKYWIFPYLKNKHESKMKKDAFEREKFWRFYKSKEEPLEEAIIKLEKELDSYNKKEKDLHDKMNNFEKEKSKFEKTILEEKIKVYKQIIKEIK